MWAHYNSCSPLGSMLTTNRLLEMIESNEMGSDLSLSFTMVYCAVGACLVLCNIISLRKLAFDLSVSIGTKHVTLLVVISFVLLEHLAHKLPISVDGLLSKPPWSVGHHSAMLWFKFNRYMIVA